MKHNFLSWLRLNFEVKPVDESLFTLTCVYSNCIIGVFTFLF